MKNTMKSFFAVGALTLAATANAQTTTKPFLPLTPPVVSTIPSNGDVNPYGVFFVPRSIPTDGTLQPGDILVSNFNNSQNLQGTGTTITRVDEQGNTSTFYQGKPGLGLTAALGVVRRGLVFVGNLPTTDGTSATVQAGSLLILDRKGKLLTTLVDPKMVQGPWGMAIHDDGDAAQVFYSNVLNGTITRLDFVIPANGESFTLRGAYTIGSGFNHRTDPAALVLGPSGLHYDPVTDNLYVASSADNAVYVLDQAGSRTNSDGTGTMIYQDATHLHGPLDLIVAPNGHLIVANSDGSNVDPNQPSELVEFSLDGKFVAQYSVDKNNGGAFGVGMMRVGDSVRFAAVDDNANTLNIWTAAIQ
jgi:DNA-binding beta-propeller fold protein YncE